MRVLHITGYYPGRHKVYAGAEIAAKNIITLMNTKHNCFVAYTTNKDKTEYKFTIKTIKDYIGDFLGNVYNTFFTFDYIAYRSIIKIITQTGPDVIHLHNANQFGISAIKAIKAMGRPVVFSVYDYWALCPKENMIYHDGTSCNYFISNECKSCIKQLRLGFLRNIPFFLNKRINDFNTEIKKIDKFILLSDSWKSKFNKFGIPNKKMTTIMLPIPDHEPEQEFVLPWTEYGIIVATIQRRKGALIAVKAMIEVMKISKYTNFVVVGPVGAYENDYMNQIKDLIKENGLEDRFIFTGKLNNGQTHYLIKNSKFVIVAEQWPIAYPIALTEAMVYGKPTVSGRIGGIPDFIKHNKDGYLVKYYDPKEYSKYILKILNNPKLSIKIGKQAKLKINKICNNKVIFEKINSCYRGV